jgi:uncharacterized protein
LEFEWDEQKNDSNLKKHGVCFEEACEVWADEFAQEFFDSENSEGEDRFIRVGHNQEARVLFVVFCERGEGDLIRIISARKATRKERGQYEKRIRS